MKKTVTFLSHVCLALSFGAFAQAPVTELINPEILELERGHSVDIHSQF